MKNSNFKIAISLIVFVISLALLVGGYQLYMKYGLIDPLKQQLEARPAVASAAISEMKGSSRWPCSFRGWTTCRRNTRPYRQFSIIL